MLFSFIIQADNSSYQLKRAIDSIINQPKWDDDAEIIIIIDGLNQLDLSLQKYVQYPKIKFINHPYQMGAAEAENLGIINARNKFVVLLNANNLLVEHGLAHLKKLVQNNNYDLFFCGTRVLKENKLMYDPDFVGHKSYYDLLIHSVGSYLPICNRKLMRNNLFKNVKGHENIAWFNLAKRGYRLYFDNEPICLYDKARRLNDLNSINKKEGYLLFLKEFGIDLKYLNYNEYLKLNIKLFCSYFSIFNFLKVKPSKI